MWTNDDYTRGVYRAHGAHERCMALASLDAMLEGRAAHVLAVVRHDNIETLEREWFVPILRALEQGRVREVDLYLDGWQIRARRSLPRRLFSRTRPVAEWMRSE